MAEAAREIALMSSEEYLARENDGAWRHEFVNGAVYAMVGTSDRHNVIALNLASELLRHLPERCQVFANDMKVQVRQAADHRFYYPDVFVSCAPSEMGRYTREEPLLVAEVLSPSTERVDRGEKFEAYTALPSLDEYALIAQDRRRVEVFRRSTGWRREVVESEGEVLLASVGLTLPLAALYRRAGL
jgi:Uma2 family endonuclease